MASKPSKAMAKGKPGRKAADAADLPVPAILAVAPTAVEEAIEPTAPVPATAIATALPIVEAATPAAVAAPEPVEALTPAAIEADVPALPAPTADVASESITMAGEAEEPVAEPVAAPIEQKDSFIMATVFETPKFVSEFNERAKAAVEQGNKALHEAAEFSKGNVEAMVESSRIAAKGFEAMGQNAADFGRKSFEGMTATLKSLSGVKSPTEFFQIQSDYLRAAFDSAVAEASKGTEAFVKLAGDAAQPLSSRVALVAEKVKQAA